jgi:TusA-related sulfurtransferase
MNIQIDAKGKQCPLPVIEAKNAISGMTEAGIVEVTVDNEIAVQNLTKMADQKG